MYVKLFRKPLTRRHQTHLCTYNSQLAFIFAINHLTLVSDRTRVCKKGRSKRRGLTILHHHLLLLLCPAPRECDGGPSLRHPCAAEREVTCQEDPAPEPRSVVRDLTPLMCARVCVCVCESWDRVVAAVTLPPPPSTQATKLFHIALRSSFCWRRRSVVQGRSDRADG